jgi:hypothetical protein
MTESIVSKLGMEPPKPMETASEQPTTTGSPILSEKESLAGVQHTKTDVLPGSTAPGAPAPASPGSQPSQGAKLGGMLSADLCVNLMDSMLPGLMVAGAYYAHIKIAKKDLQLTEKEKQTLSPVVEACLNSININMENPWLLLTVSVGIIYGSKFAEKATIATVDAKEMKEKEQQLAASNVIDMQKHQQGVKTDFKKPDEIKGTPIQHVQEKKIDPETVIFSEQEIKHQMKKAKSGREAAIKALRAKLRKSIQ